MELLSFLTLEWGGRVSDKQITKESDFFIKVSMGYRIPADRDLDKEGIKCSWSNT